MTTWFDPSFPRRLTSALEANENFTRQTRLYDGRVLLDVGDERCFLKIYCGRVIDVALGPSPLGYTVKVTGRVAAWEAYFDGERSFEELATPGRRVFGNGRRIDLSDQFDPPQLWFEGDIMEAMRIYDGLCEVLYTVRNLVQASELDH